MVGSLVGRSGGRSATSPYQPEGEPLLLNEATLSQIPTRADHGTRPRRPCGESSSSPPAERSVKSRVVDELANISTGPDRRALTGRVPPQSPSARQSSVRK